MFGTSLIFVLKSLNKARELGSKPISRSIKISKSSSSLGSRNSRLFYKGSLKVSKVRALLDHKISKLGKARARNVRNESDFCPKIIK